MTGRRIFGLTTGEALLVAVLAVCYVAIVVLLTGASVMGLLPWQ